MLMYYFKCLCIVEMSSGGDSNQLPRGLIGRTGTPSGKGTRYSEVLYLCQFNTSLVENVNDIN